jgi:anti-anti-sigma factor
MLIRFAQQPPWTVAELLVHRLDEVNSGAILEAFLPVLEQHPDIVFELSRLDFIDPTGIATLLALRERLASSCRFRLAGQSPILQRLQDLSRLPATIGIYPSLVAATA